MDQNKTFLSGNFDFDEDIDLVLVAEHQIGKHLLIQEFRAVSIDCGGDLRREKLQKLEEQCRDQLFEERIVVDRQFRHRVSPSNLF